MKPLQQQLRITSKSGQPQKQEAIMNDALFSLIDTHFEQEVAFLQELVQCNSVNPLTPDRSIPELAIECEVAHLIVEHLTRMNFMPALHGVSPKRPNVVCTVPSPLHKKKPKTLILTTHMDTVIPSAAYTKDPFGGQIEQQRMYGVGVADAKAQIAAFIYATYALIEANIPLCHLCPH
jgi:acetylornithine deacetylase/succinyl-diaminopimelate desuccinylase-like protein